MADYEDYIHVVRTPLPLPNARWTLTFLHWPHPFFGRRRLANDAVRWEDMARRIIGLAQGVGINHVGLTLTPAPDPVRPERRPRQITIPNVSRLTGDFLQGIFESMLQSDETLRVEGFRIVVDSLEGLPRAREGGRGRMPGCNSIPKRLKNMGLGEHPKIIRSDEWDQRMESNCGFRALLLEKGYAKKSFESWVADAEELAANVGCFNGVLTMDMLPRLLILDDWEEYRIIVFNERGVRRGSAQGDRWVWPQGTLKTEPDPHTVHLLLDSVTEHYWWIGAPKTFIKLHRKRSKSTDYKYCYICYPNHGLREHELSHHTCNPVGYAQCPICLEVFNSADALNRNHKMQRVEWPDPCDNCGQQVFFGPGCHARHFETNCHARTINGVIPISVRCDVCKSRYRQDRGHECKNKHVCLYCNLTFDDPEEKRGHRCRLRNKATSWAPLVQAVDETTQEPKGPEIWNSHWAYDFETTRKDEVAPDTYRLAVMAWAIRLMIPDQQTYRFIQENGVLASIHARYEAAPDHACGDIHLDVIPGLDDPIYPSTLRIQGNSIAEFVWAVEHLCAHKDKEERWKPTLWAHNGSKFDVKFVFNYYSNEMNMDVATHSYDIDQTSSLGDNLVPERDESGAYQWVQKRGTSTRKVIHLTSVSSKILRMTVGDVTYKCSHAHHAMPLRSLPAVFGLDTTLVKKGEFPYNLLKEENWGTQYEFIPALALYETEAMPAKRRLEVAKWWIGEAYAHGMSRMMIVRRLLEALVAPEEYEDWLDELDWMAERESIPWDFNKELWAYLYNDVDVLAICMERYHRLAVELHGSLWDDMDADDPRYGDIISPLDTTTSPGWAYNMYTHWFMNENAPYILTPAEYKYVRASLKGGRTDKRCNYVEVTKERRQLGDSIAYYDFTSLYPSVQACEVHDTHYPEGVPWFVPLDDPLISQSYDTHFVYNYMESNGYTGFLTASTRVKKFVTHPTLHYKGVPHHSEKNEEKLLFANSDMRLQTYAWPELKEAIDSGEVDISCVNQALLFKRGTNAFSDYVNFFFKVKDAASRPPKNPGLRSLAKLMLNSLWGKLGQQSYPTTEWVTWQERLDYLEKKIADGLYDLMSFARHDDGRLYYTYRPHDNANTRYSTAPQLAAFVSMWGRVILHKKILRQHGQRVLYCDTDSAIIYLRPEDTVRYRGDQLGELTNELPDMCEKAGYDPAQYPDLYIKEFVAIAPKTYAYRIAHDAPPLDIYKVVCKGFEPSWKNAQTIHFDRMKEMAWMQNDLKPLIAQKRLLTQEEEAYHRNGGIRDGGKRQFVSTMVWNKVVPTDRPMSKMINGKYDKGENHPVNPQLVIPFGLAPLGGITFLDFPPCNPHFD